MPHLEHYGVKGMKWGVRRYQNPDGTRTRLGKEHYKQTVFVSGSSKTQDKESEYHRRSLPKEVKMELDKYIQNGGKILVGDAPGIDRQTQEYLNRKGYMNVEVYGPGKQVRYSANEKWKTNAIDVPGAEEFSKEWLAGKDKVMTEKADHAIAVILDEGAKATRKNVDRLFEQNKNVMVYELSKEGKENDKVVDYRSEVNKRKSVEKLNELMNSDWDYGVMDHGNRLIDTQNFNWGRDYRTTPVEELEKTKIGTCWDFVNYQHAKLKEMGIPDKSFMILIPKSSDPDDLVTHTFTIFGENDKDQYWLESAAWPKRGVHKVSSYKDVVSELMDMYGNPGHGYSLYQYNPEGMDQGLTDKQFFNRATDDRNLIDSE